VVTFAALDTYRNFSQIWLRMSRLPTTKISVLTIPWNLQRFYECKKIRFTEAECFGSEKDKNLWNLALWK
jgi:hypothetical protein